MRAYNNVPRFSLVLTPTRRASSCHVSCRDDDVTSSCGNTFCAEVRTGNSIFFRCPKYLLLDISKLQYKWCRLQIYWWSVAWMAVITACRALENDLYVTEGVWLLLYRQDLSLDFKASWTPVTFSPKQSLVLMNFWQGDVMITVHWIPCALGEAAIVLLAHRFVSGLLRRTLEKPFCDNAFWICSRTLYGYCIITL